MWSEQVAGEAIEGKLWPRGAALAERLWSDLPTGGFYKKILHILDYVPLSQLILWTFHANFILQYEKIFFKPQFANFLIKAITETFKCGKLKKISF